MSVIRFGTSQPSRPSTDPVSGFGAYIQLKNSSLWFTDMFRVPASMLMLRVREFFSIYVQDQLTEMGRMIKWLGYARAGALLLNEDRCRTLSGRVCNLNVLDYSRLLSLLHRRSIKVVSLWSNHPWSIRGYNKSCLKDRAEK